MKKSGNKVFDILVIGGGPAGLSAAISAGQTASNMDRNLTIGIIEKKEVPGKKLSATGNGRCNISNTACCDNEVNEFFDSIGLIRKADEAGRIYPYSEEAGQVTSLLVDGAKEFNTEIITDCQVSWVKRDEKSSAAENGGFVVGVDFSGKKETKEFNCKKLLIATGGKSYGAFGSTGDGFAWAKSLGHSVTRLAPSLVPVQVEESEDLSKLAGLRVKANVSLIHCNEKIYEEKGEVQFNKDSISGICIMNISKLLVLAEGKPFKEAFAEYKIKIDMAPDFSIEEVSEIIKLKKGDLTTLVKKKMAAWIKEKAGGTDTAELAGFVKNLEFKVAGTKGWNEAQVTRGGVLLEEVDQQTMESKLVKGLYFAGEVLNYDGFCGGYNLNYAWLSGSRAGKDMAKNV